MKIGVISDTHGLLRDEAVEALHGSDLIIHAGDVGGREILENLSRIAPVHAVRGNTDYGEVGATLPRNALVEIPLPPGGSANESTGEPTLIYVVHILEDMDLSPAAAGIGVVIYGHTHRPAVERRGTILYLNPGSAGPRRFDLPVTVARLEFSGGTGTPPEVEMVDLDRARTGS